MVRVLQAANVLTPEVVESLKDGECLELMMLDIEPVGEFRLCRRVPLEGPAPEYGTNWVLQPIEGLTFDEDLIEERAAQMGLEGVERSSRWPCGVSLLAEHVVRAIEEG